MGYRTRSLLFCLGMSVLLINQFLIKLLNIIFGAKSDTFWCKK